MRQAIERLRSLDDKWRMPRKPFDPAELADRIQQARIKAKLDQTQLAELCGLSKQAVNKWEDTRGAPNTPSVENLATLADALSVRTDWLLFGEEPMDAGATLVDFARLAARSVECERWLQKEKLEFTPDDLGKFIVLAYQAKDVDSMVRDLQAIAAFAGRRRRP